MHYVILGGLAVAILYGLAQLYVNLDSKALLRLARYVLGTLLIVGGVGLTLLRQFQFGIPAVLFGAATLIGGRLGPLDFGASQRRTGQASSVSARFVEATLDHDTGDLAGRVVEGRYAGSALDELSEMELREVYQEASGDEDSVALLEAYFDRRFPGWREDADTDNAAGAGSAADSGSMTDEEAYEILGLAAGAGEAEIRAAHRRLLKVAHPDQGGSTFLAARINQAKDRLLRKHH